MHASDTVQYVVPRLHCWLISWLMAAEHMLIIEDLWLSIWILLSTCQLKASRKIAGSVAF